MIVVKIELVSARTLETTELGRMVICNDATISEVDPTRGNYDVFLGKRGEEERVSRKLSGKAEQAQIDAEISEAVYLKPLRRAKVTDYPRLTYSVWVLIARALKALELK